MKHIFSLILLFFLGMGCEQKVISGVELENKLKEVIYYPEKSKKIYICQFQVNIHLGKSDTTGMVAATISNDFNTVVRTQ